MCVAVPLAASLHEAVGARKSSDLVVVMLVKGVRWSEFGAYLQVQRSGGTSECVCTDKQSSRSGCEENATPTCTDD